MNTESRSGPLSQPGSLSRAWRVRATVACLVLLWVVPIVAVQAKTSTPRKQNPNQGKGPHPRPVQGGGPAAPAPALLQGQRGSPPPYPAQADGGDPTAESLGSAVGAGQAEVLGEIRPGRQALTDSMARAGRAPRTAAAEVANCEIVSLSSPGHRPDKTLMDLSGDGLIVSAVDRHHVEVALGRGWHAPAAGAGPVRRCMALGLVEELLKPMPRRSVVARMALVKVDDGWQLVSRAAGAAAAARSR